MRYFKPLPTTLEELKRKFKELALINHPDKGGDTATMQAIKNEYDALFPKLKNIHKDKEGKTYTAKQSTNETPEHFKQIIDELMRMENITVECIGCFIWVTGDTKNYKNKLKELKFLWHSNKKAWYLKPENYKRQSQKLYEFDEIREMYGTTGEIKTKGTIKIEEAVNC